MSGENIEVWDDDFLEELNQVEQLALSSSSSSFVSQPPIPNPTNHNNFLISYSPPRHLSQRPAPTDDAKDLEILRLKRELGLVSKRLSEMEQECLELEKDKNEKEKRIKLASSKNDPEVANIQISICKNSKNGVPAVDHHEVFQQFQNAKDSDQVGPQINTASSSCKAMGIQVDLTSHFDLLEKLRAIWGSPADQELGKAMIYKLFVDCSREFHVLFGCMNMNTSAKMTDSLAVKSSVGALQYHTDTDRSEAEKITHFYSMLTKISNGMMQLEALLEPLLGLCHIDNVVVVSTSLRVLQVFLKHLLTWKNKAGESALYSGTMSWSREFFLGTTSEIFMDPVLQKIDCFM